MKCPKCGSEMAQAGIRGKTPYWFCKCGHEENAGGEKG